MKKNLLFFIALIGFGILANAQEQRLPANNFSKKEIENFQDNKFGWKEVDTKGAKPVLKKGHYLFSGKRPTFSPDPVSVVSSAVLPFEPQSNFKITVNLSVVELTEYSVFQILLNSGSIVFAIAEGDWAVVVNNPTCQGLKKTSKGDNVNLSIQKEGTTLYFSYNNTVLCTTETDVKTSDIVLSIVNIVKSAEIKINEVIVEQ